MRGLSAFIRGPDRDVLFPQLAGSIFPPNVWRRLTRRRRCATN